MKSGDIVLLESGPGSNELIPAILESRISKAHALDNSNTQIWTVRFLNEPKVIQTRAVNMTRQREIRRKFKITKLLHSAKSA